MTDDEFIQAMLDDYNTVAEFYNSPESFIEKHNLSEGLKKALQADEDRDLADLGIDSDLYTIAMSGRHTTGGYCLLMVAEKMQGTAMGDWAAISAEKLKLPTT